jgi:hypothetical protein
MSMDSAATCWTETKENARSYTGFWMLPELLGWLSGGAEGNRTPDLCSAIAALSHLSYSPQNRCLREWLRARKVVGSGRT